MRKTTRLLPITIMMVCALLLSACGSSNAGAGNSGPDASTATVQDVTADPAVAAGDETNADTNVGTDAGAEQDGDLEAVPPEADEPEDPTFELIPDEFACSIRVSINPEVLLYLDKDYTVIGIRYDNEDAKEAYDDRDLKGMNLDEAMDALIATAIEKKYLKADGTVSIELADVGDRSVITDDSVLRAAKASAVATLEKAECECTLETEIAEEVRKDYSIEKTMIVCPTCGGTGIICPGDHETPNVNYDGCGGTGETVCMNPICNGGACTRCGGSGKSTCPGCNGAGVNNVDGATCNHCGGSGKISCEYCHGSGKCERCGGTGRHACYVMDKHRACETCGGTGMVEE